jgi:hypothetical protein
MGHREKYLLCFFWNYSELFYILNPGDDDDYRRNRNIVCVPRKCYNGRVVYLSDPVARSLKFDHILRITCGKLQRK